METLLQTGEVDSERLLKLIPPKLKDEGVWRVACQSQALGRGARMTPRLHPETFLKPPNL